MFSYKITYLNNGVEQVYNTDPEVTINFAIRKRISFGNDAAFYFILKHNYEDINNNELTKIFDTLAVEGVSNISIYLVNDQGEENILFNYVGSESAKIIELDTEVNIDNLGENNIAFPFETVLRVG